MRSNAIIMYKNNNVDELNMKIPYIDKTNLYYVEAPFEEPYIISSYSYTNMINLGSNMSDSTINYILKAVIDGAINDGYKYIHNNIMGDDSVVIDLENTKDTLNIHYFRKLFNNNDYDTQALYFYDCDESCHDDFVCDLEEDEYVGIEFLFLMNKNIVLSENSINYLQKLSLDIPIKYNNNLAILTYTAYNRIIDNYLLTVGDIDDLNCIIVDEPIIKSNNYDVQLWKYLYYTNINGYINTELSSPTGHTLVNSILLFADKNDSDIYVNNKKINIDNIKHLDDFCNEIERVLVPDKHNINIPEEIELCIIDKSKLYRNNDFKTLSNCKMTIAYIDINFLAKCHNNARISVNVDALPKIRNIRRRSFKLSDFKLKKF